MINFNSAITKQSTYFLQVPSESDGSFRHNQLQMTHKTLQIIRSIYNTAYFQMLFRCTSTPIATLHDRSTEGTSTVVQMFCRQKDSLRESGDYISTDYLLPMGTLIDGDLGSSSESLSTTSVGCSERDTSIVCCCGTCADGGDCTLPFFKFSQVAKYSPVAPF